MISDEKSKIESHWHSIGQCKKIINLEGISSAFASGKQERLISRGQRQGCADRAWPA